MKKIISFILLLGVLCLAGCSKEEEPQSVSFLEDKLLSPYNGQSFSLEVHANCLWNITSSSASLQVNPKSGEGNMSVTITVSLNAFYEVVNHTISIKSEDNTSSDALTIFQEAKKGIEVNSVDIIPEEGGTISIPISTNDNITKVNCPDWISFTSSRALTEYTYTFTVEPNKTGSVRSGEINVIGENASRTISISQDSYTPESVSISLPSMEELSSFPLTIPLKIYPQYADASKINASATNGSVELVGENLVVDTEQVGEVSITLSASGKVLYQNSINVIGEFYMQSDDIGLMKCEGEEVSVLIKSNDKIIDIKTPNWLEVAKQPSGGSLTYKIKASANKTGKVRTGVLTFCGERKSLQLNVVQDSYTPKSITIPDLPESMGSPTGTYRMVMQPEYADWSKVSLAQDYFGTVSIKDSKYLSVDLGTGGAVNIKVACGKNILFQKTVKYIPEYEKNAFIYEHFGFGSGFAIYFQAELGGEKIHFDVSKYEVINKEGKILMSYERAAEYQKRTKKYVMKTDGMIFRDKPYFPDNVIGLTFRVYAKVYGVETVIDIPIDISAIKHLLD